MVNMMNEQMKIQAARTLGLDIVQEYSRDNIELIVTTKIMFGDICILSWEIRENYDAVLSQLNERMSSIMNTKSITEEQITTISALE